MPLDLAGPPLLPAALPVLPSQPSPLPARAVQPVPHFAAMTHTPRDRWLLRPALACDAPAVLEAFTADPLMSRQGDVTDLASAERYLARLTSAAGEGASDDRRAWVAVDGSGPARALVGISADRENRLGWFFYWAHPAVRGRGLMTRAAIAVADLALLPEGVEGSRAGLGLERLELGHRVSNPESGAVAVAAGFVREGCERAKFLVDGERVDVLTYGRLRTDPAPAGEGLPVLSLRPLAVDDAERTAAVLADPALYRFTGGEPPTPAELRERYALQTRGLSPDGSERWVNELVLLDGEPVGYVQATVPVEGTTAELAWVVGSPWQGRGLAVQATRVLADRLAGEGVTRFVADIHPEHVASQGVARDLGMEPTGELVDGEARWATNGAQVSRM